MAQWQKNGCRRRDTLCWGKQQRQENQQSRKKWGNFEKQHPNTAPEVLPKTTLRQAKLVIAFISKVSKKEGHGALKVKPKKGSAIVFEHDYPGSSGYSAGDSLARHTGRK